MSNRRILVVEDEMMISMLIEDMLEDLGYEVVGVAQSLPSSLTMATTKAGEYDMAILDINLAGEQSFPVARLLMDQGVPFMFATGYGQLGLEEPFRSVLTLNKPFQQEDLGKAVEQTAKAA